MKWKSTNTLLAVVFVALSAAVIGSCTAALRKVRDAGERSVCKGKLYALAIALHHYEEAHRSLPPPYVVGPDGKPWHSWRVLLLPFFSDEIYREYRFDEPWNGPNNSKLAGRVPRFYSCPSDPDALANGFTNCFVVPGPECVFRESPLVREYAFELDPPHVSPRRKPWLSGRSPFGLPLDSLARRDDTILVVESTGRNINWMEPRDLRYEEMSFELNDPNAPSFSSRHRRSHVQAAMADGTVKYLNGESAENLRRMCRVEMRK